DVLPFQLGRRRIECAEDKRARQSDSEQRLAEEAFLERFDVDGHIREFRHRSGDYRSYMRNVLSGVLLLVALAAIASGPGLASSEQRIAGRSDQVPTYSLPAARCPLIPVQGVHASQLKSTFNEGRAGHLHHAIDILAPRGTPVLAAVDGT